MKNLDIKPGEVVPPEIRLKVYTRALNILLGRAQSRGHNINNFKLCFALPRILWGINPVDCAYKSPGGARWWPSDTPNMFPELKEELFGYAENSLRYHGVCNTNAQRIAFLKRSIKELKQQQQSLS